MSSFKYSKVYSVQVLYIWLCRNAVATTCTVRCARGGKWKADPNCPAGWQLFNSTGSFAFTILSEMLLTVVRVLVVGGGGGGACGDYFGGAGGYVACGTFDLSSTTKVSVLVGAGGSGAKYKGTTPFECCIVCNIFLILLYL